MKAVVYYAYGPPEVLRCEEIDKPTPGDNEVLLKIHAASVNPLDWHFMRGTPYFIRLMSGLRRPKTTRLGVDVAGQVEAVGRNVTRFKPGDEVFGACRGAFAEYACASESGLAVKPANVTFEQAAAVPIAGLTALQGLRDGGKVQAGQKVLINGAAGGVGTFAVQIAKSFGAEVIGVCSTRNVELVRSLGADRVVDYTREDFTSGAERYDVIFDCIGNHPFSARRRVLKRKGICVVVGGPSENQWLGPLADLIKEPVLSRFVSQTFVGVLANLKNGDDLAVLGELMKTGTVKPAIDRRYPLSDAAEAIRYLEQGHARGKVVITV